jgi:glutamate dehydrogenase
VTDEPYLAKELYRYFPEMLADTYPDSVSSHRLRREVIATVLCNAMINRGGPAFVVEAMGSTTADVGQVARAYAAARDTYGLTQLNTMIDGIDGKVPGAVQLTLYADVQALLRAQTLWFLRNTVIETGLGKIIERFEPKVAELRSKLPTLLPQVVTAGIAARVDSLMAAGVPEMLARRIAELPMLSLASDVVLVAERAGTGVSDAAEAFFGVIDTFGIGTILSTGPRVVLADRFDRMAFDRAFANLMRALRDLSADILGFGASAIPERIAAWHAEGTAAIDRVTASVAGLTEGDLTVSRLSVAAGLLSDLARTA